MEVTKLQSNSYWQEPLFIAAN